MKKLLQFLLFLAIGLAVFFVVMAEVGFEPIEQALLLFFNLEGLAVILLTFLAFLPEVARWRLVLKTQGQDIPAKGLFKLWLIGFSMSYLTPFAMFGGEVFRIYFLKKRFPAVPWEASMSSEACGKILEATVFFLFLIAGIVAFLFYGKLPATVTYIGVFLIAAALFGLLFLFYFKRWKKESAFEWVLNFFCLKKERITNGESGKAIFEAEKEVFRFFSLKNKALWQALCLTFLWAFLRFARIFFLLFVLAGNTGLLKTLAVFGFVNLAAITPLPANLGALELGVGLAFQVLGFGFSQGAVFSIIWRAADLVWCLAGVFLLVVFSAKVAEQKLLKFFSPRREI